MTDQPGADDGRSLFSGSAFFFVARVIGAALAYVTQILLARWMGADELGAYLLAFAACLLLSTASGLGYPSASFRFIGAGRAAGDAAMLRGYIYRGRQFSLIVGIVIAAFGAFAVIGADGLISPAHRPAALLALACVPAMALIRLNSDVANGFAWLGLTIMPNTLIRPALFFAACGAAWWYITPLNATTVMGLHLAAILAVAAGQHLWMRGRLSKSLGRGPRKFDTATWTRAAWPMGIVLLLTSYFPEFNVIVVGLVLSPEQVAFFNAAFRTAFLIAFMINAIDANTLPDISVHWAAHDRNALELLLGRAAALKTGGAIAFVAALAVVGKPLLSLFGEDFVAGYPALLILAAAQVVQSIVGPVSSLLEIGGHQDRCLIVFIVAAAVAAGLHIVLAPTYGITGSAVAVLAAVAVWSAWLYVLVRIKMGLEPSVAAFRR